MVGHGQIVVKSASHAFSASLTSRGSAQQPSAGPDPGQRPDRAGRPEIGPATDPPVRQAPFERGLTAV